MEDKIQEQLDTMEAKISEIAVSVKKTERYMKVTFWATVGLVVLPFVIAVIIVPMVLSKYAAIYEGLI
jgi:hypothetical protein